MRRALGFKLTSWARHLRSFIDYCEGHHAERITTELALAWATQTPRGSSDEVYWSRRLMVVRIFARHLYEPGEITALIGAAGRLTPPLRAASWQTLIGLLAVTGMRKSEACRLDRDQVDLDTGALVIADSKFGKSRRVLLHQSTVAALRQYEQHRDRWCPAPAAPSFFVSTRGTRLDVHNITHTFADLVNDAGIQAPPGRRRPRMHDLRHAFTVATLLDFYHDGGDVQARLPLLSTWLGHVDPKSTYWYLQAIPELLALAAGRLELAFGEQ